MTTEQFRADMRGVFGFPVTPFLDDLSIDYRALERHVDWMSRHPFCALVAAGGMGEIYSLSPGEIVEVVRVTVNAAAGRMPVVAGAGFNLPVGQDLARRLEAVGAAALLVMPPYYVNAPMDGLIAYYRGIAESCSLPISLYSRDWAAFSKEAVAKLCEEVPRLVLWKDGQGDLRRLQKIMQHVGDRLAWVGGSGDDNATGYFAVGVQAFTSSISNIAPRLSIAIANAGLAHDFVTLNELKARLIHPLFAIRERKRGYEVAVMKRAMKMLGLEGGRVRPPLEECSEVEEKMLEKVLAEYGEYLEPAAR